MSRSGTTWTARALGQSAELVYIGEAWLLNPLRKMVIWYDQVYCEWGDFTVWKKTGIAPSQFRDVLGAFYQELLLQASGGKRFVEKTPGWNISDLDILVQLVPEAYYVLIYRDGRNQVASLEAHHRKLGAAFDFAEACRRWGRAMDVIERYRSTQTPLKSHVVRYEDLVQSFDSVFATLCRFVDIVPFRPTPCEPNTRFAKYASVEDFNRRWHGWPREEIETFKREAGRQLAGWDYVESLDGW